MKNPIQPLVNEDGILRFKRNEIVRYLLDSHPNCDMNSLAALDFSDDDRQQFAQLLGYSLGGYAELTRYVDNEAYELAENMAKGMDERDAKIDLLEKRLEEMCSIVKRMQHPMRSLLDLVDK